VKAKIRLVLIGTMARPRRPSSQSFHSPEIVKTSEADFIADEERKGQHAGVPGQTR
jgi:hypothetical protein